MNVLFGVLPADSAANLDEVSSEITFQCPQRRQLLSMFIHQSLLKMFKNVTFKKLLETNNYCTHLHIVLSTLLTEMWKVMYVMYRI